MSSTWLIYGGLGWIGSQFCKYLQNVHQPFYLSNLRVDDISNVQKELDNLNPSRVICMVGRTNGIYEGVPITTIDYLEKPGKLTENIRDNLFSPISLAILCNQKGIHFTYLGTGCIFDGDNHRFLEDDLPNYFGSSYSIVKGFTDRLMHLFPDTLNLRIRMPISADNHPRNFITKITGYKKICNIPNSMTVLSDFYPIFYKLIRDKKSGTYNCTNPGVIDHNTILSLYKKYVNPDFVWENFSIEEQNKILLAKRSNNQLDTQKIKDEFPHLQDITTSVENIIKNYSK